MFQDLSIKFKKTSKNTQSKKANKGKTASLESTRIYERTLARIIENQEEILSELKVIKDKVRRIENCLNNLEQKMDIGFDITNDKAFKENMIKEVAKALIEKAIYSENSQIKSEAEKYVRENYAEYFEKFTLKDWNVYYVNNIHGLLLQKIRFSNPDKVIMWKKSTKTIECYQKLFEELEEGLDDTYINRILHKIWPDGNAPPEKIAYAIAICQTMLNPKNKIIMMSDHIIKKLIAINLNKLKYCKHFSISSSEDETSQEDRDKSDDNNSENDNTEQGSKCKNNLNYSNKMNKRPRVKLVDLDLEEVQEAENNPDEDVNKEKDMDDIGKFYI
ncbi:hypothetical protein F8M41_024633 [Gigaspora margarita]|uniref:Uncharacterized protein n=1 Tax=Gigaspora margarita TaxID=4874 RepID=A0A8H4ABF0_GIGMA|nr:hypothetical protein F8M41_024633 [Gigaspora margarita]